MVAIESPWSALVAVLVPLRSVVGSFFAGAPAHSCRDGRPSFCTCGIAGEANAVRALGVVDSHRLDLKVRDRSNALGHGENVADGHRPLFVRDQVPREPERRHTRGDGLTRFNPLDDQARDMVDVARFDPGRTTSVVRCEGLSKTALLGREPFQAAA